MDLDEEVEAPPKRITTAHYIKFINELFNVMERDETMKEYYWVMDNATIQKSLPMQRKIEIRGYIVIDVTAAIFLFWKRNCHFHFLLLSCFRQMPSQLSPKSYALCHFLLGQLLASRIS